MTIEPMAFGSEEVSMVRTLRRWVAPMTLTLGLAACGGGGAAPTAPPTPTPTPIPPPATPTPSPTPDPACGQGLCEDPTTNTAPPVRVILRFYQLFDANGAWVQPTPDPVKQIVKEPMPLGYTIRLDLTAKDKDEQPTNGMGHVDFAVSDPTMVDIAISGDFQRKIKILKPGQWEIFGTLDGVASNSLGFTFCDPKADPDCKYP
jgi:hypothetical protein